MSRIVVAEDDPHILRVISMWLTREGHEVLEARNGLAALELLKSSSPNTLITDINMPGLDGLELLKRVRADGIMLEKIIVLTNRWDHREIGQSLAEWGVEVVPKPFSPSRLSQLVENDAADSGAGVERG